MFFYNSRETKSRKIPGIESWTCSAMFVLAQGVVCWRKRLCPQNRSMQRDARFDQSSRCWLLTNWFVLGFRMVVWIIVDCQTISFLFSLEVLFLRLDFIVLLTWSKAILREQWIWLILSLAHICIGCFLICSFQILPMNLLIKGYLEFYKLAKIFLLLEFYTGNMHMWIFISRYI